MADAPSELVVWLEGETDAPGTKLAQRLHVPALEGEEPPGSEQARWVLFYEDEVLYLFHTGHPEYHPIAVDYLGGDFYRRWKKASRNDQLPKAIGLKKGVKTVCDATAGLGYDAFFLATFRDLEVVACERNPVAAELLMDALLRLKEQGQFEEFPLYFHFGDSIEFLKKNVHGFDAVYLDPMFPREEERSAKQKKEMALFRELVGKDLDAEELFSAAWDAAKKRVVVKRPDDAEEITQSRKPDFVVPGSTVRYDVYLKT